MAKTKERRNEGIIKRFVRSLKERSAKAHKATIVLLVLILMSMITGICGAYLYTPAKEGFVAQQTFEKEARKVYDYPADSQERNDQISKRDEAEKVYTVVMDKYSNDTNALVSRFTKIHSMSIKGIIAFLIVLPFMAIAIMFIGHPINFLFALANICLVWPIKAIIALFKSFREPKTETKRIPSHA